MNGYITGLRFYKGATNVGAHIGNLWTSTGTLLGSVPFTTETARMAEVRFATGVPVVGGATYVASYYAPNGHFSVDRPYFAAADFYNEPLRAPRDTVAEPNGVFKAGGGFPTETFGSSNYWVDVVFETTAPVDNTPPTVSSVSPAANATGVSTTANVTATFSERVDPATITSTTVRVAHGGRCAGGRDRELRRFRPGPPRSTRTDRSLPPRRMRPRSREARPA